MRRALYVALAVIVGVPLLASVSVALLVDADYVLRQAGRAVNERTGLELTVEGSRTIGLWPQPGGRIENVRLGDSALSGGGPLLTARVIDVRLTWTSLLERRADISTLRAEGIALDLARAADGQVNWDVLAPSTEESDGSTPRWRVDTLNISDAKITFTDTVRGQTWQVNDFTVQADDLGPDIAVEFRSTGALAVPGGQPPVAFAAQGTVKPPAGEAPWVVEHVELDAEPLKGSATLTVHPGGTPRVSGQLDLERIQPRKLMQLAAIESPRTRDPDALTSASISTRFDASEAGVELENMTLTLDGARLTGSTRLSRSPDLDLQFDLEAGTWDIDRYRVESDEAGNAGMSLLQQLMRQHRPKIAGRARAAALSIGGTTLRDIDVGLHVADSRVRLSPFAISVWHARHEGEWTLDFTADQLVLEGRTEANGWRIDRLFEELGLNSPLPLRAAPSALVANVGLRTVDDELLGKLSLSAKVPLEGGGDEALSLGVEADGVMERTSGTIRIPEIALQVGEVQAKAELELRSARQWTHWRAKIDVAPFAPRKLLDALGQPVPAMSDSTALGTAEFTATMTSDGRRVTLEPVRLKVDESTATGRLSIAPGTPPAFETELNVDFLDADRYGPADTDTSASANPTAPLKVLQRLNLNGSVTIGTLKASGSTIENLRLEARSPTPATPADTGAADGAR